MVPFVKAADKTQSEKEPSKPTAQFILVSISLHANRKTAII